MEGQKTNFLVFTSIFHNEILLLLVNFLYENKVNISSFGSVFSVSSWDAIAPPKLGLLFVGSSNPIIQCLIGLYCSSLIR